jgi:hypothetical protein
MAGFVNISSADSRLPLSIGRASDGREQVFSLTTACKTARLRPEDAARVIGAVGGLAAAAESGNARDEIYLHVRVVDFDGDTSLRVKLEICRGLPSITVDDEVITPSLDSLAELASDCWEARGLAVARRGGRRSMGAILAKRYNQQRQRHAAQDQANPTRSMVDQYGDWVEQKVREY